MKMAGSPQEVYRNIISLCPEAAQALENSAHIRGQLEDWQAALLYHLAMRHDGGNILEIGTLHGYSASLIAQAAPDAEIITLNSAAHEIEAARRNLAEWPNVQVIQAISWDYLEDYDGPMLDMVFVDGDHKRVARDVPWWDWVCGLILFHDYSPEKCPPVYEAVNGMGKPDVLVMDDEGVGMAGFYRKSDK